MNDTIVKISDMAWSKMEALSRMRKFIQKELDHALAFPVGVPPEKFQEALTCIDRFSAEFSRFLSMKSVVMQQPELLESQFEALSDRYTSLMEELEQLMRP